MSYTECLSVQEGEKAMIGRLLEAEGLQTARSFGGVQFVLAQLDVSGLDEMLWLNA